MPMKNIDQTNAADAGIFYGYIIVGLSFIIMMSMWGAYYAFGVFFKPIMTEFGWTRATVSGASSLAMFLNGVIAIAMGSLTDRFGPRLVLTACGILLGIGYFLMSKVTSVWQLYLFYGVIIGVGMGGSFIPLASTIARWFVKKRNTMTGIVVTGIGIGAMVAPPVAARLITTFGWRTSYSIIGAAIFVVIVSASQLVKREPALMGLTALGEEEQQGGKNATRGNPVMKSNDLSFKEAFHTGRFWALAAAFFCFGYCLHTIMVHIVPHTQELGFSPVAAANMLATIGGMSIAGKLLSGVAGDRIGSTNILMISFILLTSAMLWLLSAKAIWMLLFFSGLFGFAYGGSVTVHAPLIAELFGLKSHGLITGVAGLGVTVGGAVGPLLTGYIFDINGSYQMAFLVSSIFGLSGVLATIIIKKVSP